MSTKDQRIVMTRKSSLPICNPNLMPFHIGHTGPAAVSMFLRVEKMKAEEEAVVVVLGKDDDEEGKVKLEVVMKEGENESISPATDDSVIQDKKDGSNMDPNAKEEDVEMQSDLLTPINLIQLQDSQSTDVEMTTVLPTLTSSSSLIPMPSSASPNQTLPNSIQTSTSTSTLVSSESLNSSILPSSSIPSSSNLQISSSNLKDIDKRFISSFRGRTIHGLTVDLPTGYTGLLLHSDDPQLDATQIDGHETRGVLKVEVESGFEREDKYEDKVDAKGSRRTTRSKSKGVAGSENGRGKAKEMKKAAPRGRLARTAAPKRVVGPEVITIDTEDQEMTLDPTPSTTEPVTSTEIPDRPSQDSKLTIEDMNAPDESVDDDLEVDKGIPLHKLIPQSTFSSITLWHADRAVDESRDEYYRTLTEWMALSHEVSIAY